MQHLFVNSPPSFSAQPFRKAENVRTTSQRWRCQGDEHNQTSWYWLRELRMHRFSRDRQKEARKREAGQERWGIFKKSKIISNYDEKVKIVWNHNQVPEDLQKLKKTLSDKTKKKIAENNRKFSICKLCRYQLDLHSEMFKHKSSASNVAAFEAWWTTCTGQ